MPSMALLIARGYIRPRCQRGCIIYGLLFSVLSLSRSHDTLDVHGSRTALQRFRTFFTSRIWHGYEALPVFGIGQL
jgi:hypothetical protein